MTAGAEHVVGFAVPEEDGPLALAHDKLRPDLELPRSLLGDAVDHLRAEFVYVLDKAHEGHLLPPCSGDEVFASGEVGVERLDTLVQKVDVGAQRRTVGR